MAPGPMDPPMAPIRRGGDGTLVIGGRETKGVHRPMLGGAALFVKALFPSR
jgi:hypothetical protein